MSRTSTGAPGASATTPLTVTAAMQTCLAQPQRRPHRSVVGPDRGEHLAVEHLGAVRRAHQDVVDLTVRAAGGPGPPSHRAAPPGEEGPDTGAPEVAVAGDDAGTARRGELGGEA